MSSKKSDHKTFRLHIKLDGSTTEVDSWLERFYAILGCTDLSRLELSSFLWQRGIRAVEADSGKLDKTSLAELDHLSKLVEVSNER